jgi:uncharacterized membrane protein
MTPRDLVIILCALGCGLLAGFFFAFSICVMKALGKLPPAQGIAAMQSINVVVINPWFLLAFLGTAVLCGLAVILALLAWQAPAAPWSLAGGVLYVAGTFLVTMRCNVPRNNALAALAPDGTEAAALWTRYLSGWTAWNHVRMVAALAASASFTVALYLSR